MKSEERNEMNSDWRRSGNSFLNPQDNEIWRTAFTGNHNIYYMLQHLHLNYEHQSPQSHLNTGFILLHNDRFV